MVRIASVAVGLILLVALAVTAGLLSSPTPDNNQGFRIGPAKLNSSMVGIGTTQDWSFCNRNKPCSDKQGDCDNNDECVQDYICGRNNCRDFWGQAESAADCCIAGGQNLINVC